MLFPLEAIKTNLQAQSKSKKAVQDAWQEEEQLVCSTSPFEPSDPASPEGSYGADTSIRNIANEVAAQPGVHAILHARGGQAAGRNAPRQSYENEQEGGGGIKGRLGWTNKKQDIKSPSVASVARDIHSREGVLGFYKGVYYSVGQSAVEKAAYFYSYGRLKALALLMAGGGELSTMTDLGLGYLAEACHLPLTMPIEVS